MTRKRGRPTKENAPRHAVDGQTARCGCGLLLPCAKCLPRAGDYATARGDGGSASLAIRSKAA